MVVTAQHLATGAGLAMLRQGGNAIDAAVAVGYALAVVHPCCGNLGGGGFMTVHLASGRNIFLNFREKAPLAASADMFLGPDGKVDHTRSRDSYLATGVPGTVRGLDAALARYGKLSRKQVMAPAIKLARDGYVLGPGDAAMYARSAAKLARDPAAAKVYLPHGHAPQAGERFRQPALAHSLELIAREGDKAFLPGADRPCHRRRQQSPRRRPVPQRLPRLPDRVAAAGHLPLSRLWDCVRATAEFRRRHVVRDVPRAGRLAEIPGLRLSFRTRGARSGRGDALRVCRPQHLPRRPGFCAQSAQGSLSTAHAALDPAAIPADRAVPSSTVHGSLAPRRG